MNTRKSKQFADELQALATVLQALENLNDQQRSFVVAAVAQRFALPNVSSPPKPTPSGAGSTLKDSDHDSLRETPKTFLKEKRPITDVQRIACLAFYLTHGKNTPHFKTRDLTMLNTEAAGDKIGNATQAVKNATNQNHFISPAGRGNKQITPLGEDVVNVLPDQEKVKAVIAEALAGRRKRRPSKARQKKKH
jgi:hypothetical protein